jgi:hypothetical protein
MKKKGLWGEREKPKTEHRGRRQEWRKGEERPTKLGLYFTILPLTCNQQSSYKIQKESRVSPNNKEGNSVKAKERRPVEL